MSQMNLLFNKMDIRDSSSTDVSDDDVPHKRKALMNSDGKVMSCDETIKPKELLNGLSVRDHYTGNKSNKRLSVFSDIHSDEQITDGVSKTLNMPVNGGETHRNSYDGNDENYAFWKMNNLKSQTKRKRKLNNNTDDTKDTNVNVKTPKNAKTIVIDADHRKILTPETSKNVTVVGPAAMGITHTVVNDSVEKQSIGNDQQSIEERLKVIEGKSREKSNASSDDKMKNQNVDDLIQQLINGLKSRDRNIIENILDHNDEIIMRNVIKKLPMELITTFLHEIQGLLYNRGEKNLLYLSWMEMLLQLKLSFLMTLPNIEHEFSPLRQLFSARTDVIKRLYSLKGRLNLMFSQMDSTDIPHGFIKQKAQIHYESTSSEEESDDEMIILEDNGAQKSDDDGGGESEESTDDDHDESSDDSDNDDDMKSANESDE